MTSISNEDYQNWRLANNIMNLIICIVFMILYIRGFHSLSKPISSIMKWISLIYVIFYTIRYLENLTLIIIMDYHNSNSLKSIEKTGGDIGFVAAHSLFYLLMFARLYYGFLGSAMELSKIVAYGYIFSQFIIICINSFYFTRDHGDGASVVLIILVICDLLLGAFLIYSFTKRLFQLVIMQRDEVHYKRDISVDTIISSPIEINDNQKVIMDTITKYTLLCSLGIVVRDCQFFAASIVGLINYKSTLITKLVFKYWWTLVLFTELFTVYLSFNFAKKEYNAVCSCCHSRLKSTCNAIAGTKIKKQLIDDMDDVNLSYHKL